MEISRLYRDMQTAIDRWEQQTFLVLWAQKEDLEGRIDRHRAEEADCKAEAERAASGFTSVSE